LWDGQGNLLTVLEGHKIPHIRASRSINELPGPGGRTGLQSAVFNHNGSRILTAGFDRAVQLWRTYSTYDAMLAEAEHKLGLVLPQEDCAAFFEEFDPVFCTGWDE
jgi:hypothetical protein